MSNVKMLMIAFLILLLCGFTDANDNAKEAKLIKKFQALQAPYFQQVNLYAAPEKVRNIPKFSLEMNKLADEQRALLAANPDMSQADKEWAGLIYIYDAMLMLDGFDAVTLGKLTVADLVKTHHFAKPGADDKEELKARATYALSELEAAAKLRPNDRRIDGWIVGAKSILERIDTGGISKQTQEAIVNAIPVRPSFNLWTALIVLHNENAASLEALATEAKNFVDASTGNSPTNPCTIHPEDCVSGPKAPYNFQGAVVELGDIFLRRAEYYLQKGDTFKAMIMTKYTEGTYAQLNLPANAAHTQSWPARDVIALRMQRLAQIKQREIPTHPLVPMPQYQRAYECGSCHSK